MAQFKFEKSAISQKKPWTFEVLASKVRFGLAASPHLVAGTAFFKKASLDHRQVALLSEASLKSMEETRDMLLGWHRMGHTLADIYLNGIGPAANLLGERWLSDEMSFVNGTIAFSRLHQILHEFSAEFLAEGRSEPNGLNLLLMTEPASKHGLGVFMLSEFFRQAGWNVSLAAPQDLEEFKRIFHSDWFDAVTLSISTDRQLGPVAQALLELVPMAVNPHLKIFVGGPMAQMAPEKLAWPGIQILNEKADRAVSIVTQAMKKTERQSTVTSGVYRFFPYA